MKIAKLRCPVTLALALFLPLTLVGCSAPPTARSTPAPGVGQSVARTALPPANGQFDYQIGGSYAPERSVGIVDRDREDQPVAGLYSICYVNAFQTQPAEKTFWTRHHRSLLLKKRGKLVTDPGWPGEFLLDTSTAKKRAALARIVGRWIDGCAASGFQAVEPDNLDSWTRSRGRLRRAENVAYAKLLIRRAHVAGLAIAQKNTAELGRTGKNIGFDFAIAEECQVYAECGDYTDVYGAQVVEVEYADDPERAYADACAARGDEISVILRDRGVVPEGFPGYVYRSC